MGRNFQRHCPSRTAVPQVIPTDWKLQPCVVSTDSEVREPVGTVDRSFLGFRKNFTYVKFALLAALSVRIAVFSFAT